MQVRQRERHLSPGGCGGCSTGEEHAVRAASLPDTDGAGERRKQTVTRDWNKWASYVVIVAFVFHPCFLSRKISGVPDHRRGGAAAVTDGITAASRLVEFADRITDQPLSVSDVTSRFGFRLPPTGMFHRVLSCFCDELLAFVTDVHAGMWLPVRYGKIVFWFFFGA